jgi:hypothetical protein
LLGLLPLLLPLLVTIITFATSAWLRTAAALYGWGQTLLLLIYHHLMP